MARLLRWSYPLRTLFITINLIVLFLPIVGIVSLRIFENVLHRQTEAKLIAEGAYIHAAYLQALDKILDDVSIQGPLIRRVDHDTPQAYGEWRPYPPTLDLSRNNVLPVGPDGVPPKIAPHPVALKAGKMIQPIIEQAQLYNLSGVRVLDANGVVVASTGSQLGEDLSNRHEIREALSGRYCSVFRERQVVQPRPSLASISRGSKVRVYVAIPMLEGEKLYGIVYLHRTGLTFFRDLWESKYAWALIIIIAITMTISLLLSFIVTRPLKSMIVQAERIGAGESGVSLEVGGSAPSEAHQLSQALSAMVKKLEQRMEYVEEFTRNVSHEFKTPLTGIQGAIELLREGWEDMTDRERSRFHAIIEAEVKRMERLVKRLLELARIEMAAPADEQTDLGELLAHITHRYQEAGNNVTLEKNVESASATIAPDMAETMFVNLLDNAAIHGKGAPITVIIGQGPKVQVRDKGPGISPANLPRIFDRFFTAARESGGTGLGLAMVKAIAENQGASISVISDREETVFTIDFCPIAKKEKR